MSSLDEIIERAVEEVDEIDLSDAYPEDQCHEIADQSVPIYTSDVFEIVPELNGYELSDPGLLGEDNPSIERIAQVMIYDQVSNACHQRLYERQEELEDWELEYPDEAEVIDEALAENARLDSIDRLAARWVAEASRDWHANLS